MRKDNSEQMSADLSRVMTMDVRKERMRGMKEKIVTIGRMS